MSLYFVDLIAIPLLTLIIAALTPWSWSALAWTAFGLTAFTFVEYWVHRVFLHHVFWSAFHQRHHRLPSEYVTFPWYYLPLMLAAPALVLPWPMLVGWYIGMMWFYSWHHVLHHWDLRRHPWLKAYSNWHELHHKDLPVNYGITHPGWDFVFGTYCPTDEGHRRLMEKMVGRKNKIIPEDFDPGVPQECYPEPRSPSGIGWRPPSEIGWRPNPFTFDLYERATNTTHVCANARGGSRCHTCFKRLP